MTSSPQEEIISSRASSKFLLRFFNKYGIVSNETFIYLKREVYFGTGDVCHVRIKSNINAIKEIHAIIAFRSSSLFIEVKGDTFINGVPIYQENTDTRPIEFFLNDRIVFGSSLEKGVQIEFVNVSMLNKKDSNTTIIQNESNGRIRGSFKLNSSGSPPPPPKSQKEKESNKKLKRRNVELETDSSLSKKKKKKIENKVTTKNLKRTRNSKGSLDEDTIQTQQVEFSAPSDNFDELGLAIEKIIFNMLSIQRREKMKNHSLHLQTINSFITVDCIPYLKRNGYDGSSNLLPEIYLVLHNSKKFKEVTKNSCHWELDSYL